MRSLVSASTRRAYAALLREFLVGACTNDEYEDRLDEIERRHGVDSAVGAIHERVWFLYDDLHEHTLRERHRPTRQQRRFAARCVLFLRAPSVPRSPRADTVSARVIAGAWLRAACAGAACLALVAGCSAAFGSLLYGTVSALVAGVVAVRLRAIWSDTPGPRFGDTHWPYTARASLDRARRSPTFLAGS